MTDEQINIAIAEHLGWRLFPMGPEDRQWIKPLGVGKVDQVALPDYCDDLNAIHEAENSLTDQQIWNNIGHLVGWTPSPSGFPLLSKSQSVALLECTARQRAEAYLRTIGKWEDGE